MTELKFISYSLTDNLQIGGGHQLLDICMLCNPVPWEQVCSMGFIRFPKQSEVYIEF